MRSLLFYAHGCMIVLMLFCKIELKIFPGYVWGNIRRCSILASFIQCQYSVELKICWKYKHKNLNLFCLGSSLAASGSTIIGENTGVFVGGIPQGYSIVRKDVGEYDYGLHNMVYLES